MAAPIFRINTVRPIDGATTGISNALKYFSDVRQTNVDKARNERLDKENQRKFDLQQARIAANDAESKRRYNAGILAAENEKKGRLAGLNASMGAIINPSMTKDIDVADTSATKVQYKDGLENEEAMKHMASIPILEKIRNQGESTMPGFSPTISPMNLAVSDAENQKLNDWNEINKIEDPIEQNQKKVEFMQKHEPEMYKNYTNGTSGFRNAGRALGRFGAGVDDWLETNIENPLKSLGQTQQEADMEAVKDKEKYNAKLEERKTIDSKLDLETKMESLSKKRNDSLKLSNESKANQESALKVMKSYEEKVWDGTTMKSEKSYVAPSEFKENLAKSTNEAIANLPKNLTIDGKIEARKEILRKASEAQKMYDTSRAAFIEKITKQEDRKIENQDKASLANLKSALKQEEIKLKAKLKKDPENPKLKLEMEELQSKINLNNAKAKAL